MTANRGPIDTTFTEQEISALLLVKPTPYMDEADRIDPSWAIPSVYEPSESGESPAFLRMYKELFGIDYRGIWYDFGKEIT